MSLNIITKRTFSCNDYVTIMSMVIYLIFPIIRIYPMYLTVRMHHHVQTLQFHSMRNGASIKTTCRMTLGRAQRTPLHSQEHTDKAWDFFSRMGSPKLWVAPMVDAVSPKIVSSDQSGKVALSRFNLLNVGTLFLKSFL